MRRRSTFSSGRGIKAVAADMCRTGRTGLLAWERMRKPEPWVHVVLEASHGADPVAGEGEDEHAGAVADAIGTAEVGAEGWLAVGSGRDEVESPAWAEDAGAETGDDISP